MAVLKFLDPADNTWKPLSVVNDGVTFTPTVSAEGILSWTNNGFLPNPDPISLVGSGIIMKDNKSDFPTVGSELMIYIDKSTSILYRWDASLNDYISLSGGVGGAAVSFVASVPAASAAETGIIYAVKQANGNFELWAKENGEMVLLEGADDASESEVHYYATSADFPATGKIGHIYISTSTNLTYRWDPDVSKYLSIGDQLGSVEAGSTQSYPDNAVADGADIGMLF